MLITLKITSNLHSFALLPGTLFSCSSYLPCTLNSIKLQGLIKRHSDKYKIILPLKPLYNIYVQYYYNFLHTSINLHYISESENVP